MHKHKKYLRAKEPYFYKFLKKDEILKKLNDYGILESEHKTMDEVKLQNFVQKLETTRNIAIWYDHATIGNRSHVLFTFQLIYNKATYVNPHGIKIDDMQKEIEIPQIYMLGISKETKKSERSFDDMRLDDVLSLSNPVKLDNIIFKDSFKISFGDNPVRCCEMGQNKSGRYRVCSLPLNIDEFYSFKDLLSHKHLTINEKRAIACKGIFFDSDDNNEVNLQEINSSSYCRSVSIPFTDAKDAAMKQSLALCGIKSTPAMLSKHPYTELGLLNLNEWDVLPMEVLQDIKGLVKKSFECIPGSIHLGS